MHKLILVTLILLFSHLGIAATKTYQTEAKSPPSSSSQQEWRVPVISINPDTGKKRVFISPDDNLNNSLVHQDTQVYHARAAYSPTPEGVLASMSKLHQQMAETCASGWLKLQEWTTLNTSDAELHVQFQCLQPARQD